MYISYYDWYTFNFVAIPLKKLIGALVLWYIIQPLKG